MKLWGGRFEKSTDKKVDDFHSSIAFDARLYRQDIKGSIAHAKMLAACGIISGEEGDAIVKGLESILDDIDKGKIEFSKEAEDIHMNIESLLIEKIGDVGKKLHTGRSRNDQVALDIRMYLKDEIDEISSLIATLQRVLLNMAKEHQHTLMPGYTHLQPAQPITLAHHLMAYFQMFKRDWQRFRDCRKRTDIMPLGSGALAGTTYPLNRNYVADMLDFSDITDNSLDGVSDRDFALEFLSCCSILMMHLSRFCEEIILWATKEFDFIELDDGFSTGSSIMPQKKNPDVAELIRGKTGRVYGNLISLLTVMKSLPLAYNKDMQEDKEPVFDAVDTVKKCVAIFTDMVKTTKFKKDNMKAACLDGFLNATDAADYLVGKGIPFRRAHEITGRLVLYCIKNNKDLQQLSLDEYKTFCQAFDKDIYDHIDIKNCVYQRKIQGGPSPQAVAQAIKKGEEFLQSIQG
ncbi:MAG TPA: argininosuccinate lyase [Clostridiales bacterium]|nr:argininosuccinate lyase [Clostridiales bacterium]